MSASCPLPLLSITEQKGLADLGVGLQLLPACLLTLNVGLRLSCKSAAALMLKQSQDSQQAAASCC